MAAYTSLDQLQEAFLKIDNPEWELYSGKPKTRPTGPTAKRTFIASSSDGLTTDLSWEELSNWLQGIAYGGGNAVVFYPDGQALDLILSKRLREDYTPGNNHTGVSGFAGNNQMFELWKQNYELQRTVEDLQTPSGSAWEQLGNRLLETIDFNQVVPLVTSMLQGRGVQPQVTGNHNTQETPEPTASGDMEKNLQELMQTIQEHYGNDEEAMSRLFKGLSQTIKNNPSVLNNL